MNIIVAVAAFIISACAGGLASGRIKDRANKLNMICADIRALGQSMELTGARLNDMLQSLGGSAMAPLWREYAALLERSRSGAREAWRSTICAQVSTGCLAGLDELDKAALITLGDAFGAMSRTAQREQAAFTLKRMEARTAQAEAEKGSKGKLYSSLGVLMGFALAIMLL